MRIARVFPRRTAATPDDDLAFVGDPPSLFPPEIDEVHISVTFTWDIDEAYRLEKQWRNIAPVKIGGPATGERGEDFEPGRYLKPGYVITSRGCRNRCWFCSVWRREGDVRELTINEGWNVLDDNLLSTSGGHFARVCRMLSRQKRRPEFTGGLEAAILSLIQARYLRYLNPKSLYFAYDTPDDRDPLFEAGELLRQAGFTTTSHVLRAYVLIGYPRDTFEAAEGRLTDTLKAGFLPIAMIYRDETGYLNPDWVRFRRNWFSPQTIYRRMKNIANSEGFVI